MDTVVINAYFGSMLARVFSILVILAITVVTTISAAHAARMGGMQMNHEAHLGAKMHASCEHHQQCQSAEAALCEFFCTGLSVFLTMPGVEAGQAFGRVRHNFPAEAFLVGRAPGLIEHPPKLRFL